MIKPLLVVPCDLMCHSTRYKLLKNMSSQMCAPEHVKTKRVYCPRTFESIEEYYVTEFMLGALSVLRLVQLA